jgi:hypothetical protein
MKLSPISADKPRTVFREFQCKFWRTVSQKNGTDDNVLLQKSGKFNLFEYEV